MFYIKNEGTEMCHLQICLGLNALFAAASTAGIRAALMFVGA
jgi:hypothetical protein